MSTRGYPCILKKNVGTRITEYLYKYKYKCRANIYLVGKIGGNYYPYSTRHVDIPT